MCPAVKYIDKMPRRANTAPKLRYRVNFIVAYSLLALPHIPIRGYIGMTASS